MDHTLKAWIIATLIGIGVLGSVLILRTEIEYQLYQLRVDWHRRRYLTAAERAELREQHRLSHFAPTSREIEAWVLRERETKRSKFRPDLLIDPYTDTELIELTATELVTEYRQAIVWRRTAQSWCAPHTTNSCLDGFPVVRQWREQTEALEAEYERRTSDPVHRWLSWRERRVLRRAAFEFGDYEAHRLPLPLHSDRPDWHPSFDSADDPAIALKFLPSIESTEE